MQIKLVILFFLMIPGIGFSQFEKLVTTVNDAIGTVTEGTLTLLFINAENGKPVSDATADIKGIGKFTTNLAGRIVFESGDDETYLVRFEKVGYVLASYPFEIVSGAIPDNKITVSPEIKPEAMRIVLVWGREPPDLDLHFAKKDGFHTAAKIVHNPKDTAAKLNRTDNTSYGPETITIANIDNQSAYTCWVDNYSGREAMKSTALARSGATVQIYKNNQLVKTITVPPEQRGPRWNVFSVEKGEVMDWDSETR
jgi:hypothetical protein